MELKLLLGAIIIVCGALAGRAAAGSCARRAQILSETMDGIQMLRIHMLDRLLPLRSALERSQSPLLRETGQRMGAGGAENAWKAVSQTQSRRGGGMDALTDGDRETLDAFFARLGGASAEEQRRMFEETVRDLGRSESECRKANREKTRLYAALGALAGAAAAIAFL